LSLLEKIMTMNIYAGWGQLPAAAFPRPTIAHTLRLNQIAQAAKFDALSEAVTDSAQTMQTALANLNVNCTLVFPASVSSGLASLIALVGTTNTNIESVATAITNQPGLGSLAKEVCELRECVCKTERAVGTLAGIMSKEAPWPRQISKSAWTLLGFLVELRSSLLMGTRRQLELYLERMGSTVVENAPIEAIAEINEDLAAEFLGLFRPIDSTDYESGRNERLIEVARVERSLMIELG
jgi:hypothetical protein